MPRGVNISLPDSFKPSEEDLRFAAAFKHIASLLIKAKDSEKVTLRISTCRNAYLTANALFADLRIIMGHGAKPSPVSSALKDIERGKTQSALSSLNFAKNHLSFFNEKVQTWNSRNEIDNELKLLIDDLPSELEKDEITAILDEVRCCTDNEQLWDSKGHVWDKMYFEISADEPIEINRALVIMKEEKEELSYIVAVASALCSVIDSSESLFSDKADCWNRMHNTISSIGSRLGFIIEDGIISWQTRSGTIVCLPQTPTESTYDQSDILKLLANHLDSALRHIHETLALFFKPNIGMASLPKPFLIDLSSQRSHSTPQSYSYELVPEHFSSSAHDHVKIAYVDAPLPIEMYRKVSMSFVDDAHRQRVFHLSETAIDRAHIAGAEAICFPEYFLPRHQLSEISALCREKKLVLIGGVEGVDKLDGALENQAVIALPETDRLFFQDKHTPSGYEPTIQGDGKIRVFESTSIGNFVVILCSDYLEIDLLAVIATYPGPLHHIFVCTCNPHNSIFVGFARSDCYRLFSNVYVINNRAVVADKKDSASSGVTILSPQRNITESEILPHSVSLGLKIEEHDAFLRLADISLDNINGALCEKPRAGIISTPKCRRIRKNQKQS